MLTRTVTMHECRCACCDEATGRYLTARAALDVAKLHNWCFDYRALGLLVCWQCNEEGRIPNVDEDLALTVAPDESKTTSTAKLIRLEL